MKKLLIPAIVAGLGLLGAVWYVQSSAENSSEPMGIEEPKPQVVTTLFPVYDIAKDLAGDGAEVSLLLDPGVDSHSFEPSPSDIVSINNADLFIYTGEEMEPWVASLLEGLSSDVTVVNASEGITLIEGEHEDHGDDHAGEDDHSDEAKSEEHGELDPHFWLDFDNTQTMVGTIKAGLQNLNSMNSEDLTQRELDYIGRLEALDTEYVQGLSQCESDTIVHGGHFTFGYLVQKYDLKYEAAQGINPDSEPTAQNIANLIELVRESNTQAVYSEELLNARVATTIAEEAGVPVLRLNGAHNITKEDFEQGVTFFDLMEENLENLKVGLVCN